MRLTARALVVIGAMVAGGLGVASPAHAVHVTCGQTITQDTVLDSDVGPCLGTGINIGADNITLNLNGHWVRASISGFGEGAGIRVFQRTGVTVTNGGISGFDGGVVIEGGSGNTVSYAVARDNIGRTGTLYGDGIAILSSPNNVVLRNIAYNNGPFAGIGVYSNVDNDHPRQTTGVSSGNLIDGNLSVDNVTTRGGIVNNSGTEADGLRLEPGSARNIVVNNEFSRNGLDGISLFSGANGNIIRNNAMDANGFRTSARRGNGINVFGGANGNIIEDNRVTRSGDHGISVGSQSNLIRRNLAVDNAALPPINPGTARFDLRDTNVNCDNNQWVANRFGTRNMTCIQ